MCTKRFLIHEKNINIPVLNNNKKLIYFDNAATTLKPECVIQKEIDYLTKNGANPHANDYENAFESNQIILSTRKKVAELINATNYSEIVFTSGTTYSINQVAFGLKKYLKKDDEIIVNSLEHSANLMPWIVVAKEVGVKIISVKFKDNFSLDLDDLKSKISSKTKIIAIAHISNTLGNKNDIKKIVKMAKDINENVIISVDCAQSIAHEKIDVKDWNADFVSFSAHKMYGPFGLGVLWGKYDLLDMLEPLTFGGGMSDKIESNFIDYKLAKLPNKLEAGTPNISSIASFNEAIDFLLSIGLENIKKHELDLKKYAIEQIIKFNLKEKIEFYNLNNDSPIILFNVKGLNPQDVSSYLWSKYNIACRSGGHCVRRSIDVIDTDISVRISFAIYNTKEEIDILIKALQETDNFLDIFF